VSSRWLALLTAGQSTSCAAAASGPFVVTGCCCCCCCFCSCSSSNSAVKCCCSGSVSARAPLAQPHTKMVLVGHLGSPRMAAACSPTSMILTKSIAHCWLREQRARPLVRYLELTRAASPEQTGEGGTHAASAPTLVCVCCT